MDEGVEFFDVHAREDVGVKIVEKTVVCGCESRREFFVKIFKRLGDNGEKFSDVDCVKILFEMVNDDLDFAIDGGIAMEHDEFEDVDKETFF